MSVRFSDPELGYQIEMRQIPLVGVSADLKAGGGPRIEVIVGRTDFDHTAHSVFDPKAIRLEEDIRVSLRCSSWRPPREPRLS